MAERLPDILPLAPHFREVVWGGRRLQALFGKALPAGRPIGESFELSAWPGRESRVREGALAGMALSEAARRFGGELLGAGVVARYGRRLPLLVKLLDAREDLSVQVHPGDAYARARGLAASGKMEAWLVLHSEGGRVAHGLAAGVGRAQLLAALEAGRPEEVVRFYEVAPGDVVFSPPGTVHALGAGVVAYEVQQASDLTFRLYDYDRPGLDGARRPLQVEQALEVIDFEARLPGPRRARPGSGDEGAEVVACEHFTLHYHRCASSWLEAGETFAALTLVSGEARACGTAEQVLLRAGETALLPAGRTAYLEARGAPVLEYVVARASLQKAGRS